MEKLSLEGIAGFSLLWLLFSALAGGVISVAIEELALPDYAEVAVIIAIVIGTFAPPTALISAYCYNQIIRK